MPISFKKCVIRTIFSLNLSLRFNTFDVNKIFKYVHVFINIMIVRCRLKRCQTATSKMRTCRSADFWT